MIAARIQTVLLHTDAPELVLARDSFGRMYLALLVDRSDSGDRFVAVPVSPIRLSEFRSGSRDLRSVLLDSETGEQFCGSFRRIDGKPCVEMSKLAWIPEEWLPDDGFFLANFLTEADDSDVVKEAIDRGTAVLVCHLNPPESREEAKIDAERLTQCVSGFQTLIKHIVKRQTRRASDGLRAQLGPIPGALHVFQFSEGSFKIHFQAQQKANFLGASPVGAALATVDELMAAASKPTDEALRIIRSNKGLVVGAYARILRFIAEETAPLAYRWADPYMTTASGTEVTPTEAVALSAAIASEKLLESEIRTLRGRFAKIITKQTWAIFDEDGRRHFGAVHEDYPNVLSGITSETHLYDLTCEERLAETATGKQTTKLFLISTTQVPEK